MSGNDIGITVLMLIVTGVIGLPAIAAVLLIALKIAKSNASKRK